MIKLIFWIVMPTPHLGFFLRAVSSKSNLIVVYENKTSDWRIESGWHNDSYVGTEVFIDGTEWKHQVDELIVEHGDALHVFGGFAGYQRISYARRRVNKLKLWYHVITESGEGYDKFFCLKNYFRKLRFGLIWFQSSKFCKSVFCMGEKAEAFFQNVGVPTKKIFPLIYTVYNKEGRFGYTQSDCNKFAIVFVGRLILRKGVDVLLSAMSLLKSDKFSLDIIGDGPERERLKLMTLDLGLQNSVKFIGTVQNSEIYMKIKEYKLIVVPSRYDGWGAVVNESISAGVPVVASDAVGAQDLVLNGETGFIFPNGDHSALARAIEKASDSVTFYKLRENCKSFARRITPEIVADYFLRVIESDSPEGIPAPWINK